MVFAAMLGVIFLMWLCGMNLACYFPFLMTAGHYGVIRDARLSRLLIADGFQRRGMRTLPEDRDKISLIGAGYYIAAAILVVLIWVSGTVCLFRGSGVTTLFAGLIGALLLLSALAILFKQLDFWLGMRLHPAEAAVVKQSPGPARKLAAVKNGVCAAEVRNEIAMALWAGPASMAGGALFVFIEWKTGIFWSGKSVLWKIVECLLIGGGAYLLFSGLRGLLLPERGTIYQCIRAQLPPQENALTAKEAIAMVDSDLAYAVSFAGGKVLIGREWLFVRKSMGVPLIRLENIYRMERETRKDHLLVVSLKGPQDRGVIIAGITSGDADVIQLFLKERAPNLRA